MPVISPILDSKTLILLELLNFDVDVTLAGKCYRFCKKYSFLFYSYELF